MVAVVLLRSPDFQNIGSLCDNDAIGAVRAKSLLRFFVDNLEEKQYESGMVALLRLPPSADPRPSIVIPAKAGIQ